MGVLQLVPKAHPKCWKNIVPNLTFWRSCRDESKPPDKFELPPEPTTCCMSGCANCVWLDYAEKLEQLFKDGGDEAVRIINEKVSDPSVKAYLLHELRMRKTKS